MSNQELYRCVLLNEWGITKERFHREVPWNVDHLPCIVRNPQSGYAGKDWRCRMCRKKVPDEIKFMIELCLSKL